MEQISLREIFFNQMEPKRNSGLRRLGTKKGKVDTVIRAWHWAGHEFTLKSDYIQPSRRDQYVACIDIGDRKLSLVCTIEKPTDEICLDDMLDALARTAQKRLARGKTLGGSMAYAVSLHRQRRIEAVTGGDGSLGPDGQGGVVGQQ